MRCASRKTPSSVASTPHTQNTLGPKLWGRTASRRQTKPWSLGMRRTAGIKSLSSWVPIGHDHRVFPVAIHVPRTLVSLCPGAVARVHPTPRPVQDHAWESEEDNDACGGAKALTSRLPRQLPAEPSAAPQTAFPSGHPPPCALSGTGSLTPFCLPTPALRFFRKKDLRRRHGLFSGCEERVSSDLPAPSHFPSPWAYCCPSDSGPGSAASQGGRALKALGGDGCLVRHALPDNVASSATAPPCGA